MCLLDGLSKRKQVMIRIQQRKFLLAPGFDSKVSCRVNRYILNNHPLVELIDVICADIQLTIILLAIQCFKEKEMNLHIVLADHEVFVKVTVSEFPEPQDIYIKIAGNILVAHGQLWADVSEYAHSPGLSIYGTVIKMPVPLVTGN